MYNKITSGYFFNKSTQWSNKDKQQDYLNKSDEIINLTVNQIQLAAQNKDDLIKFFSEMLMNLSECRRDIAKTHHTNNASAFGKSREGVLTTSLFEKYREYNAKLILKIKTYLQQMKVKEEPSSWILKITTYLNQMTQNNGAQQTWKIEGKPTSMGKKTSIEVSVLSKDMSEWQNNEEHKRLDLVLLTYNVEKNLPVPPSIFPGDDILVTVRYEDNGIEYPLTRYLTRIQLLVTEKDLVEEGRNPITTLIHQEPSFMKNSLTEIATLFKKAIELDKENLQELIEIVSHINYLFSHAMPFDRGSAAIGEWIESIIFRYHGYDVTYNSEVNINMEALISPLDEFIQKYPSMLKISPIQSSEASLQI